MNDEVKEALQALFPGTCRAPPSVSTWQRWDGTAAPEPLVQLEPHSVAELQAMVRACNRLELAMIPQGGGTGLAGGGWMTGAENAPVAAISVARLNAVLGIDTVSRTITVGAGMTIDAVDTAAAAHELMFPLKIGSGGSAQVGGAVSTNAGGLRSWRYGNMRELVFGVEAVLADGNLWSGLRSVRKAVAGLDLSPLIVGSEGILGIVTAATLRLEPAAKAHATAFLALPDAEVAGELFARFKETQQLEVIELISGTGLSLLAQAEPGVRLPVDIAHPWYLLAEWAGPDESVLAHVPAILERAMGDGLVLDGALAKSEAERAAFWAIRERHGKACRRIGEPVQHDVCVPVSAVPVFLEKAGEVLDQVLPGVTAVPILHLGDGNIHFDLLRPAGDRRDLNGLAVLTRTLHDLAVDLGGSFSAEHGIGTVRRNELARIVPAESLMAMKAVKAALDPKGLMNPGKVL